jgi:hypothetical protein
MGRPPARASARVVRPCDRGGGNIRRLDEVAGSDRDELTGLPSPRCLTRSFLPQAKGASHGPCCYRSGLEEIADLRAERRRADRGGEALGYGAAEGVPGNETEEPGRRGDVRRGVRGGGCGDVTRTRDASRFGDAGEDARRRISTDEDRPARRTRTERGIVPDRFADGAHSEIGVARAQDDLRDARRVGGCADEGDQYGPRLAAWTGSAPRAREQSDVHGSRSSRVHGRPELCAATAGDRRGANSPDRRSGSGRGGLGDVGRRAVV